MKRPSFNHLIAIFTALLALAAAAWLYTNAREPVEGLPLTPERPSMNQEPSSKDACESAGGVWNECASACPPDAEACALMCVQKCEGLGDGESVVNVYFPNARLDPGSRDCSAVFPYRRAVSSADAARAGIEALLKGPTEEEKASGAFTSIPETAEVKSLSFKNGVATVDFTSEVTAVGGSCRVGSIRAQIEKTLLAIEGVRAVVVTVGGKTEEVLQP